MFLLKEITAHLLAFVGTLELSCLVAFSHNVSAINCRLYEHNQKKRDVFWAALGLTAIHPARPSLSASCTGLPQARPLMAACLASCDHSPKQRPSKKRNGGDEEKKWHWLWVDVCVYILYMCDIECLSYSPLLYFCTTVFRNVGHIVNPLCKNSLLCYLFPGIFHVTLEFINFHQTVWGGGWDTESRSFQ